MGRTRKGRPVNGWLVVDKPAGITSSAVVNKVRWALGAQKAGHAGTLDPAATGVLAVALGEATKTIPHLTDALKGYSFRVRWGAATVTDDAEGPTIETSRLRPDEGAIRAALPAFTGDILQVPPQVSAVKVDGERAYDLAREGVEMDLAPRPLHVASLDLLAMPDSDHADLAMVCGKGGYVRSIARDLGQRLGCLGHVLWLRRDWSGPFRAAEGVSLEQIDALAHTPELDALLLPLESALEGMPVMEATPGGALRLRQGNPGEVFGTVPPGTTVWVRHEGRALALGTCVGGMVQPSRVILQG